MENMRIGPVMYDRQVEMTNKLSPYNRPEKPMQKQPIIVLIGCGGIGFWVAMYAAMLGYQKFILFDADEVDDTNLARLPLNQGWTGKSKVVALKALIRNLRPDVAVMTYGRNFNPDVDDEVIKKAQTINGYVANVKIFDCTDNAIVQKKIYAMSKKISVCKYLKCGYEGYDIGVYSKYDIWIGDEENYQAGYRTAASNCLSSSVCAAFGLIKAMGELEQDFNMNIFNVAKGG